MGIISDIINSLTGAASVAIGYEQSRHLTGAQQEANQFNAIEAEKARGFSASESIRNREFESQQAQVARDWQEEQYLKYNSPSALIAQYQDAGMNPALMYGGATGTSASTSTSIPPGTVGSPVSASTSSVSNGLGLADSIINSVYQMNMMKYDMQLKEAQADNARAGANKLRQETEWIAPTSQANIEQLQALIDKYVSEKDRNNVESDLAVARAATERISQKWIDEYKQAELDVLAAQDGLIKSQTAENYAHVREAKERVFLIQAQVLSEKAKAGELDAITTKTLQDYGIDIPTAIAAEYDAKTLKQNPEMSRFVEALNRISNALGVHIGFGANVNRSTSRVSYRSR